ncbi:hypothetical protein ABW20_dc0109725 [Dactylellina cionopaga]|nr:hypothetical protein ABW20_dc0109725 [Dactylellina cionopaga]
MKKLTHRDYTVGWISALPLELTAAKAMLDVTHAKLPQDPNDQNTYTLGSIHGHNVVIACLPSGVYGTTSAAIVATRMLNTFQEIRFGLLVGIGGGVPSKKYDIRLGDVVVSQPSESYGGVVQYDFGKAVGEGVFQRTGSLNKPPQVLLAAVSELQAENLAGISQISTYLSQMLARNPRLSRFTYPGQEFDQLFNSNYDHTELGNTCSSCNKDQIIIRPPRCSSDPQVHYGLIASGNQVMRHSGTRDRIGRELGIICFEMEAAGLMDHFPCLVIRGICDYSDSHKSKHWQGYAAATAAAYAKELLSVISTRRILGILRVRDIVSTEIMGLVGSIIGFMGIAHNILASIQACSTTKAIPKVFKHVAIQLPLIIEIMKQIEVDCRNGSVWSDAQTTLIPVVNGCLEQATVLEKLILEMLPTPREYKIRIIKKAIARMCKRKAIVFSLNILESYKSTLSLYLEQSTRSKITYIHESSEIHTDVTILQRQTLKLLTIQWLKPSSIGSVHIPQLPGTCEWIWNEPAFLQWIEVVPNSSQLLCVKGVPGCGKSALATSVIKHLKAKGYHTLFFSFSGTFNDRQTLDSLARNLLWQILEDTSDDEIIKTIHDLTLNNPLTTTELFDTLLRSAKLIKEPVYCIIDGVDECIEECNDQTQGLLKYIIEIIGSTTFRIGMFGRPRALQAASSATTLNIEINFESVRADIELFTRTEINSSRIFKTPELQERIFQEVLDKSDGNFLWIKLMIEDLRKSATNDELMKRLQDMPQGLERLYRTLFSRLLERLDRRGLALSRKAFALTIAASRVLSVDEMRYCYALDSKSDSPLEDRLLLQAEARIMEVSGDLLNIKDGHIQLVHMSVKEFLVRPEEEWCHAGDSNIKTFRVDLEAAHLSLAFICIEYLSTEHRDVWFSTASDISDYQQKYPFLEYSSIYAMHHFIRSGHANESTLSRIKSFMHSQYFAQWAEYLAILLIESPNAQVFLVEIDMFFRFLDGFEPRREIIIDIQKVWQKELDARRGRFGEDDPRTQRWGILFNHLAKIGDHNGMTVPNESRNKPCDPIPQLMDLIDGYAALPLTRKLDLFLRLQSILDATKIVTDPLILLFEAIMRMANKIPVPALLALGMFYERLGKLDDALSVFKVALSMEENKGGFMECISLVAVGMVLYNQDKNEEAEDIYRKAIKVQERVFSKTHALTLDTILSLGHVQRRQNRFSEAEEMYRQVMIGRKKVSGEYHKYTLESIENVGDALYDQDKFSEAEAMYRQAVVGRKKIFGENDVDTLTSIQSLGNALYNQDKFSEAEAMYRQAVVGKKKAIGESHQDTLMSIWCLGNALYNQKKYSEAEAIYRQAVIGRKEILGENHVATLASIHNLGVALYNQDKYFEAEAIYRQAVIIGKETLGETMWTHL